MVAPLYVEPLDNRQAQLTRRDYLCSSCWRHLVIYPAPGRLYYVLCSQCGSQATRGYIHKSTVERKKEENHYQAAEARIALAGIIPGIQVPEPKPAGQLIKEIGF